ncbi:MAG: glycosyltransferase family 87 protein [Gemmatimonadaceae bacterium]
MNGFRAFLKDPLGPSHERVRTVVYVVLGVILLSVTAQRSLFFHPTFPIFRLSFWNLLDGRNLYAGYDLGDRFKYSPTAALLFGPFALPPFALGLLLWNTLNVVALVYALDRLFSRSDATLALVLLIPEIHGAMQRSQSNTLVAALIVLAFVCLERERQVSGYLAIALGAAIKLFPLAALSFAIFHHRRMRAAIVFAACAIFLLLLPLLVTPASTLLAQYRWWYEIESVDAFARGTSVMSLLHRALSVDWPNWPVQLAGLIVLLLPLVHVDRWKDPGFRVAFLASLLVFVVIFNHQAERPSFVIASTGVAIWFVTTSREPWRMALVLFSLTGLYAGGFVPVWAAMQLDLHRRETTRAALAGSAGSIFPAPQVARKESA